MVAMQIKQLEVPPGQRLLLHHVSWTELVGLSWKLFWQIWATTAAPLLPVMGII
jgi:hypothetical protein